MATAAPRSVPKIAPAQAGAAEEPVAPKSKKKLFITLGLLLALLGGGAAWYFLGSAKPATDEKKVEAVPVFMVLEPFTVNLQTDGVEQFLQTALTLQVADQAQVERFKTYMPEVRNRLLLLLSSKQAIDILSVDGKTKLANEIVTTLKQPFAGSTEQQAISQVFFTSFVIQ